MFFNIITSTEVGLYINYSVFKLEIFKKNIKFLEKKTYVILKNENREELNSLVNTIVKCCNTFSDIFTITNKFIFKDNEKYIAYDFLVQKDNIFDLKKEYYLESIDNKIEEYIKKTNQEDQLKFDLNSKRNRQFYQILNFIKKKLENNDEILISFLEMNK